jgi:transcriptional regulator with XRE-family HTH domain
MTPEQVNDLTKVLRERRESLGLSANEVGRRVGMSATTYWRIEDGQIASPKAETLQAIGEVLGISAGDLFASAGWISNKELPTLRPYLRTKYDLPPEGMGEIEAQFDEIVRKHGISFDAATGPVGGEDE